MQHKRLHHNEMDKEEFLQRVKDLSRENLKFIYGLVKVISLTAATIVFISIMAEKGGEHSQLSNSEFAIKLLLLVNSWMVVLVSYDGVMMTTLFTTHMPKIRETLVTFALVCLEFLLFVSIIPKFFLEKEQSEITRLFGLDFTDWWFLIYSLNAFCAFIMMGVALSIQETRYDSDLKSIVKKFVNGMKNARNHALISSAIAFIVFLILLFGFNPFDGQTFQIIIASIGAISMFRVFFMQHGERNKIDDDLKRIK
jgi:hypothetical protein